MAGGPFHIVDGTALLLRAWFAGAPGVSSCGRPVGAVRAFGQGLKRLRRRHQIERGAVVFDVSLDTFRRDLDPSYKAHRPPPPPELGWQLQRAESVAVALGWTPLAHPRFEADDLVATLVGQALASGVAVVVHADDKDLWQLVQDDPAVTVHSLRRNTPVVGVAQVWEKLSVGPHQVVDYLALVGDSSDGVAGVPGIGPKTAAALLAVADLDGLLAVPEQAVQARCRGARKLPDKLREHGPVALHARSLVVLVDDVPLCDCVRAGGAWTPEDGLPQLVLPEVDHPVWARLR